MQFSHVQRKQTGLVTRSVGRMNDEGLLLCVEITAGEGPTSASTEDSASSQKFKLPVKRETVLQSPFQGNLITDRKLRSDWAACPVEPVEPDWSHHSAKLVSLAPRRGGIMMAVVTALSPCCQRCQSFIHNGHNQKSLCGMPRSSQIEDCGD